MSDGTHPVSAPRARILIIDDRGQALQAKALLQDLGEILTAGSLPEALQQVEAGDLAVICLAGSAADGPQRHETVRLLRQHESGPAAPILLITADPDEARLPGADALVVPTPREALRSKAHAFVALHEQRTGQARALQERAQQLKTEIEGQRRALERERERVCEAERVSRLKDEFLATMSHELRTPLNAIFGWTTLLRTRRLDEVTHARALETIERNARAQKRLIDDLLYISRFVTGKVALELVKVDPLRVMEAALATMDPAAQAKGVRVVPALQPGAGTVFGDVARLQQVVCNLLSNAIKFTPAGGEVQVALARVSGHVQIVIQDSGQGIKPEFLPYVFEAFRQQDGSASRHHGGLGLGLAIVRHLVHLHSGTVEAHSAGENRGARFVVRLPVLEASEPLPTVRAPEAAPGGASLPQLLANLRLLVVDDDPASRELISGMLVAFGAQVSLADSGPAALALMFEQHPDALIADLGMPGMDGYALIEQVRSLEPDVGGLTPAIAVTAYASGKERERALHAGFQQHVAKPVEAEELALLIANLTGRVQARDAAV